MQSKKQVYCIRLNKSAAKQRHAIQKTSILYKVEQKRGKAPTPKGRMLNASLRAIIRPSHLRICVVVIISPGPGTCSRAHTAGSSPPSLYQPWSRSKLLGGPWV